MRTPVHNRPKCFQPSWATPYCRRCSPATVGFPVPKMAPESYVRTVKRSQS